MRGISVITVAIPREQDLLNRRSHSGDAISVRTAARCVNIQRNLPVAWNSAVRGCYRVNDVELARPD